MKLYVIVRGDLSKCQQAVQAGHALAEWLLRNQPQRDWKNGTLVYLKVRNLDSLTELKQSLDKFMQFPIAFREPDIGDEMTAIAILESDHVSAMELLQDLPLV